MSKVSIITTNIEKKCDYCKIEFNTKLDRVHFCSKKCYWKSLVGTKQSDKTKQKHSVIGKIRWRTNPWNITKFIKNGKKTRFKKGHKLGIGRKCSLETRTKISINNWHSKHMGKLSPNWKGGKSKIVHLLRVRKAYRKFLDKCLKRDDYTCQKCGKRGCYLEVHHIIPVRIDINKIYEINNGITVCKPCHASIDEYRRIFV